MFISWALLYAPLEVFFDSLLDSVSNKQYISGTREVTLCLGRGGPFF